MRHQRLSREESIGSTGPASASQIRPVLIRSRNFKERVASIKAFGPGRWGGDCLRHNQFGSWNAERRLK
eukprot:8115297-Lingulodinium_polyedra.AAC.1